jgi:RimJ/RimL family protein N-acetyltransferase
MKTAPRNTKTAQTLLMPFADTHLQDSRYFAWLRNPANARRIGRPEYLRKFSAAQVRKHVQRLWKTPGCHFFAVVDRGTKIFLGTAKIQFFDVTGPRAGVADIGLMIGDPKFRGRGLAGDILGQLCRVAFRRFRARKLTAGVLANNLPALRAFLRTGFRIEGRLRRQLVSGGRPQDHILLGCFPSELRTHVKSGIRKSSAGLASRNGGK